MTNSASYVLALTLVGLLAQAQAADGTDPQRRECCQAMNVHELGGVYLAGQPSPEGLVEARERGIRTVINLRTSGELAWDEKAVVQRLGMLYHHVPFRSADDLSDAVFQRVRSLLGDSGNRPVLLHCASANRVGAVWLAHRVLDHGLSFDAALAEARTVGLRNEAYVEKAKRYVQRINAGNYGY
jgi:uncharacterized protein (TIGR01244 family)